MLLLLLLLLLIKVLMAVRQLMAVVLMLVLMVLACSFFRAPLSFTNERRHVPAPQRVLLRPSNILQRLSRILR